MLERFQTDEKSPTPRLCDYALALCAASIWGGSFAATKYALLQASPLLLIFLRILLTLPVLAVGCAVTSELRMLTKREALILTLLGFQGIFFHQGIQAVAMKTAGAGNANWIMVTSPAVVAILGWIFLKEKITLRTALGLILASIGVTVVLVAGTTTKSVSETTFSSCGNLLLLTSVLNWGIFLVVSRKLLKTEMRPTFSIFWEHVSAAAFAFAATLVGKTDYSSILSFTTGTWAAIVFIGAFSSGLAYLFWYIALAAIPVAKLSVFQFTQPIVGVVISYLLVGEHYTVWLAFGAILIMLGIVWVNNRDKN